MFSVEITETAAKFLRKLEKKQAEIILNKIYSVRENPFPHIERLQGQNLWKLRVMDYRAVLHIVISGQKIIVVRIGHRKNVYDRF